MIGSSATLALALAAATSQAQDWTAHPVAAESTTFDLRAEDVNGDGAPDVLFARSTLYVSTLSWYENQGPLGFGPPNDIGATGAAHGHLELHDFGGDGDLDVLATYYPGVGYAENLGASFGPLLVFGGLIGNGHATAADLDGDGLLDLAIADDWGLTMYWRKNEGGGVFGANQHIDDLPYIPGWFALSSGDFDGDGDVDLVFTRDNIYQNGTTLYTNDGTGVMAPTDLGVGASASIPVDIDNDGDLDFFALHMVGFFAAHELLWFENLGPQNFTTHSIGTCGGQQVYEPGPIMRAGDIDADGFPDVICTEGSGVHYYRNLNGAFSPALDIPTTAILPWSLDVVDMDGDGDDDLVMSDTLAGEVNWYENPLNPPVDTGLTTDTDVPTTDTDVPTTDTDVPTTDTDSETDTDGTETDGPRGRGGKPDSGGCGCASGGPSGSIWALLIPLLFAGRRRR